MPLQENQIVLKRVRLSYANIWTPQERDGGKMQYNCALLWDKDHENTKKLKAIIDEQVKAGKEKKWGGKIPGGLDKGVRNGDDKYNEAAENIEDGEDNPAEAYEGMYYVNAKAAENRQPAILDGRKQKVTDESLVYSGCYANVLIDVYPYNNGGKKGIGFGLLAIQKCADGEPLGGGAVDVDGAFDIIEEEDGDDMFD